MTSEKTCFVIAPIGELETETRKRSDLVLKYIISPSVEPLGYKPLRADQISLPGLITSQVIQHIIEDDLAIADLTDHNPNVFYELAIRHAIKRPVIQIISKKDTIPFDIVVSRTIKFDLKDLENVEHTKAEIRKKVETSQNNVGDIETPT